MGTTSKRVSWAQYLGEALCQSDPRESDEVLERASECRFVGEHRGSAYVASSS